MGCRLNASYTWSRRRLDDATDEVFATVLTPRRPNRTRSALQPATTAAPLLIARHRLSVGVLYDLPIYKHSSNFLKRNLIGNWLVSPIYTYESPEYATVLSGVNSNLNGDSGAAIDRAIINPNGVKGTGSGVNPVYSAALAGNCPVGTTECNANLVGYQAINPNAYYIEAGKGTLPNSERNTLPVRPIDNFDLAAYKSISFFDHYSFQFGAQAFNVLNHPQYTPGSIDNVNGPSYTSSYNFQTVTSSFFNRPDKEFLNNARAMQLTAKIIF